MIQNKLTAYILRNVSQSVTLQCNKEQVLREEKTQEAISYPRAITHDKLHRISRSVTSNAANLGIF